MDPGILPIPAIAAALTGAPPLAFATADALVVALIVGVGAGAGLVARAVTARVVRHRRGAAHSLADAERRPIQPSRVGLAEDPIVTALGVGGDEAVRARRRRRPIGSGLHTPPGESPPPT